MTPKERQLAVKRLGKKGIACGELSKGCWSVYVDEVGTMILDDFEVLAHFEHVLGFISASGELEVSDKQFKLIIKTFPQLRKLSLHNVGSLKPTSFSQLDDLPMLWFLQLQRVGSFTNLVNNSFIGRLRYLSLSESRVTNAAIKKLSASGSELRYLELLDCDVRTPMISNLANLKNLTGVGLDGCTKISDKCFETFSEIPTLQLITLRDTTVSTQAAMEFAKKRTKCMVVLGDWIDDNFINEDTWDEEEYTRRVFKP